MKLSNAEIAATLEMSHSSVSRMRTGERIASVDVLQKIATEYHIDSGELLAAAAEASHGKTDKWVAILNRAFSDGEPGEDSER